jgi:poly(3-hydroxybutyrate) depolymerase
MHFFLHGGTSSADTKKNRIFFQKLAKYGDTILIFPFGE